MTNDANGAYGGWCGMVAVMTATLVILKLVDVIDWSWWWVVCPIWGAILFLAGLQALAGMVELAILIYVMAELDIQSVLRWMGKR